MDFPIENNKLFLKEVQNDKNNIDENNIENIETSETNKGHKSLINPYELLGVSVKNKNMTIKDVKKAYFGMAMLCHPDKGGSNSDMNIVQQAYEFIKEQMEHTSNMTDDKIEAMEKEFKDYMKQQEETVPPFADIYNDVQEWQKDFNARFESERDSKLENEEDVSFGFCSTLDGYGTQMEAGIHNGKSVVLNYEDIKKQYDLGLQNKSKQPPKIDKDFFARGQPNNTYHPNMDKPVTSFGRQLIQSDTGDDPTPRNMSMVGYTNTRQIISTDNSFFCSQKNFNMTDYKEAHQEPCLFDLTKIKEKNIPLEKLLEIRMHQRSEMDVINEKILETGPRIELDIARQDRIREAQAKSYIIANMPSDIDIYINTKFQNEVHQDGEIGSSRLSELVNVEEDFIIVGEEDVIKGVRSSK